MTATDTVFAGSIPAIYDRYMVPLVFGPFARLAAKRAAQYGPLKILETAAGTGVVTAALSQAVSDADIIATDLNGPMLDQAAKRVSRSRVQFEVADAQALPYPDASYDLVVCQFGVMFFPDKVRGNSEAHRVLRENGRYLLVIWDQVEHNLATMTAGRAVAELFPGEELRFYERVPFRYHDIGQIEQDLLDAGFTDIEIETVELTSHAASARDAAIALVQGTPMRADIEQIDASRLGEATDAAEAALRRFEGPSGFNAPMSARLVTAIK